MAKDRESSGGWTPISRRKFLTTATVSVGALAAAACGGKSGPAANDTAPDAPPAPSPSPSPAPAPPPPSPPPTSQAVFPLSVHGSGRCLVDARGAPFLIVGESAWMLPHKVDAAGVDAYIADRRSRGFTAVMVMLMCHFGTVADGLCQDNNVNGDPAFSSTPWLTPGNVNAAYWSYVDTVFNKFKAAGMAVLVAPAYENTSWGSFTTSDTVATNWGAWVGARYNAVDFPNIIWVAGGDTTASFPSRRNAMHIAIYNAGGTQLHTCHNSRFRDGFDEKASYTNGATWLTLNNVYCDDGSTNGSPFTIPEQSATERAVTPAAPYFLIEDFYLDEHGIDDSAALAQKWQAICSGCCGVNTGCASIWPFAAGYASDFGRNAHVGMGKLKTLCENYPWWTLVPKQNASLVSSSLGAQGPSRICPALGDYTGGKFAFIAVPTANSPTVVMTNFTQGSVRARWWDPVSGDFTAAGGSPFANTESQVIAHPGANSIGSSLWVLVLDSA